MVSRTSWRGLWRRFRLGLATLALRFRFATGKASFIEADIQMTTNQVSDIVDAPGTPPAQRLMAQYHLKTRKPRPGSQGWRRFREGLANAGVQQLVVLSCGFCGHRFVVEVLAAADPLTSAGPGGRWVRPLSYESNWFRFMHSDYEGAASLYCLRCEQDGVPGVQYLTGMREPPA